MTDEWETISGNRVQVEKSGFFVVKPKDASDAIPLFCPVCNRQMKNAQDAHFYRKYQACTMCSTFFAEKYQEEWKNGWRPTKDEYSKYY